MSVLYIVSTPIGNLKDLTFRALQTLSGADLILCEDTRETKKLLDYYKIKTPTLSYHQHSKSRKVDKILQLLKQGKNLALVSDAGTPGISDPGSKLIREVTDRLSDRVNIVPIPGPSAVAVAASMSGIAMDRFVFLGFIPTKKKRKKFLNQIVDSNYPVIFYESPYRILKTLRELGSLIGNREVVVCRELTKKFETIYRGTTEEVIKEIESGKVKGEFVVIIAGE